MCSVYGIRSKKCGVYNKGIDKSTTHIVRHITNHIALKRYRLLLIHIELELSTKRSLRHQQNHQCSTERTVSPFSSILHPPADARATVYRTAIVTKLQFDLDRNAFTQDLDNPAGVYTDIIREWYFISAVLISRFQQQMTT